MYTEWFGVKWKSGQTCFLPKCFERSREAEIILHRFTEEDILAKKFLSPKSRKGIVVTKAMGTKHNQKK